MMSLYDDAVNRENNRPEIRDIRNEAQEIHVECSRDAYQQAIREFLYETGIEEEPAIIEDDTEVQQALYDLIDAYGCVVLSSTTYEDQIVLGWSIKQFTSQTLEEGVKGGRRALQCRTRSRKYHSR